MIHPTACLLSWLIAVVALQYLGWLALVAVLLLIAAAGQGVRRRWWNHVRRARWLLVTLWLILAYGTPGDLWHNLAWAPTESGFHEGSIHVVRLVALLGVLAWLFQVLPRDRLMAGLWLLVRPLRGLRVDSDRLVVRLALVFDYLEKEPPKGSWRRLLQPPSAPETGPDGVRLELPAWRRVDSGFVAGTGLVMLAAAWLS